MYNQYFGLTDKPFSIAPDPRYLFMSDQHREALAHLMYGVGEGGGFVLLTGEVGTGKTTVCRCLLEQLPDSTRLAFILNPKLSATELLSTACDELGIEHSDNPTLKELNDNLNRYLLEAHARGEQTVLMIDEAQNLDSDVLEQIRLLTNLETNQQKLLQIILIGQPELKDLLAMHELRQLAQRITARFHLRPLTIEECRSYIAHRLSVSGFTEHLFEAKAVEELYRRTGGVPRLINVLCDRAMLGAYAKNKKQVDVGMIKVAAMEIMGGENRPAQADVMKTDKSSGSVWKWATAAMVLVAAGVVGLGWQQQQQWQTQLTELENQNTADRARISELTTQNETLAVTVASLEAEKREWDQKLLSFLPSENKPTDLRVAQQALAQQWAIDYQPAVDDDFCAYIRQFDKQCETEQMDWIALNQLDRPAVLHLNGQNGQSVYGTLLQVDEQQVMVEFNGTTMRLARHQLSPVWNGTVTYLWNTPPGYDEPLRLEMRGSAVQWLKTSLAKLDNVDLIVPPDAPYDLDLQFKVIQFQRKYGLDADAVAGPATLIALNSLIRDDLPTLAWQEGI